MPERLLRQLIVFAVAAASFGLVACGGDDETTTTPTTTPTSATGPTGQEGGTGTAPTGSPEEVSADITACLEEAGMNVLENPSSVGKSKLQLVVNAGGVGIVYIFDSEAEAEDGIAAVEKDEGDIGRETEVIGQSVIAYLPEGQTLAPSAEEVADLKACVGG